MTAESCGVRTVKSELMTLEGSVQEEESREKGKLHLGFQVRRRLGWGSYPVRILTAVTRCSGQRNNIDRMRRFDINQVPRETKCFSNPMCTQIAWETDCDSIGLRAQDCISSHLQSNADNHSEHQSQMPKNHQEHQRTTGGREVAKRKQHRWWTIVGEEHSPSCLWDGPGLSWVPWKNTGIFSLESPVLRCFWMLVPLVQWLRVTCAGFETRQSWAQSLVAGLAGVLS